MRQRVGRELGLVFSIVLYPGFVTKIQCEGRLLVSAVGNDAIVQLEALPRELGCGVILKPLAKATGKTNLLLETSTGTVDQELEVRAGTPRLNERVIRVRAGGAK